MTPKVKEALERCRVGQYTLDEYVAAACVMAAEFQRMHPPGWDEPVTVEGLQAEYGDDTIEVDDDSSLHWDGEVLSLWKNGDQITFKGVKTRGDFRELCRLLELNLHESTG